MSWDTNPYKDEPVMRFFRELDKVKADQRSLVLVTNGFLELLVESLIREKCKNQKKILDDNRSYPYSAKLLLLNEVGVMPDSTYKIFDWFRKLRNRAAHEPFFEVTKEDLSSVGNEKLRDPKELHELCTLVFAGFWNAHIDVFGPIFASQIVGKKP